MRNCQKLVYKYLHKNPNDKNQSAQSDSIGEIIENK